ncbi:MAG: mucoidy inhibitor MuiA family protein [Cocleimonas sp.]|nr:mucoidy inhibitor MuiA family protein [Cocleimonas sp.]
MRQPLYLAISLVSYTLLNPLYAEKLTVNSMINKVMVYPSSAMVTRIAKVSVPAGESSIALTGLPLGLLESSLRVTGNALANVTLGSVELQKNINRDAVQQSEQDLQNKIILANDQKQVLIDSLQQNKDQLNYIRTMASGGSQSESKTSSGYLQLPIEQWNQAWQTLAMATATTQEKMRQAQKEIKRLDKTILQLQAQLNQVATHQRASRTAVLDIQTESATELELSLRYQIKGARWQPVYDADLDTKAGKIQLKSLAQITQRTGEDWTNVEIHLSTLRPSASSQLPILSPWVVDFMPEQIENYRSKEMNRRYKAEKMDAMSVMQEERVERMLMAKPSPNIKAKKVMRTQVSQIAIADFSAEYKVPNKVSLNSGSDKRRVTLQSQILDAKVSLASVPRLDPRALLIAKTMYKGEVPLLAGTVVLHRDGNFIGNTRLAMHQTGEEIKLSFGEDDQVKIKFIPEPDKKGADGLFFGKRKTIKRNYHFSVTNQHDKAYDISFSDRIPVAANEDIRITLKGDKPTRTNKNEQKGITVWKRKLAPEKTVILEYGYEVTYPEDKRMQGL